MVPPELATAAEDSAQKVAAAKDAKAPTAPAPAPNPAPAPGKATAPAPAPNLAPAPAPGNYRVTVYPRKNAETCYNYVNTGRCRFIDEGRRCNFDHRPKGPRTLDEIPVSAADVGFTCWCGNHQPISPALAKAELAKPHDGFFGNERQESRHDCRMKFLRCVAARGT
jgi:hypothetical protein